MREMVRLYMISMKLTRDRGRQKASCDLITRAHIDSSYLFSPLLSSLGPTTFPSSPDLWTPGILSGVEGHL